MQRVSMFISRVRSLLRRTARDFVDYSEAMQRARYRVFP